MWFFLSNLCKRLTENNLIYSTNLVLVDFWLFGKSTIIQLINYFLSLFINCWQGPKVWTNLWCARFGLISFIRCEWFGYYNTMFHFGYSVCHRTNCFVTRCFRFNSIDGISKADRLLSVFIFRSFNRIRIQYGPWLCRLCAKQISILLFEYRRFSTGNKMKLHLL